MELLDSSHCLTEQSECHSEVPGEAGSPGLRPFHETRRQEVIFIYLIINHLKNNIIAHIYLLRIVYGQDVPVVSLWSLTSDLILMLIFDSSESSSLCIFTDHLVLAL